MPYNKKRTDLDPSGSTGKILDLGLAVFPIKGLGCHFRYR